MKTETTRRGLLAGMGVACLAGGVAVQAVAAQPDPIIPLYRKWVKAHAETDAASKALEALFAEEKATDRRHPNRDDAFDAEGYASECEGMILNTIKDTDATTPAGILCKIVIARGLFPNCDPGESQDYDQEFALAAFENIEALLHRMGVDGAHS